MTADGADHRPDQEAELPADHEQRDDAGNAREQRHEEPPDRPAL